MKYLPLLLLLFSCSTKKQNHSNKSLNTKAEKQYSAQFQVLQNKLAQKSQSCKTYVDQNLIEPVTEDTNKKNPIGYKFKTSKDINKYLRSYNPHKLDWHEKANLKNLYLNYDFNSLISQKHFEISNNLKDCSSEFYNMNFLKAALYTYKTTKSKKTKALVKTALKKYGLYIKNKEIPLISVLITNHLIEQAYTLGVIKIKDLESFKKSSEQMKKDYIKAGKEILKNFRNKNYKDIYAVDKKLRLAKSKFKNTLIQAISN